MSITTNASIVARGHARLSAATGGRTDHLRPESGESRRGPGRRPSCCSNTASKATPDVALNSNTTFLLRRKPITSAV
ncbi:MAG: hypothetical protein IPO07_28510 [Haliscomenobacter sp.]|nr:hypothetical protein [Haliscomenobacter sp.]MBK9492291.1 hypothetical protein [Haliscomenobacter sp.]